MLLFATDSPLATPKSKATSTPKKRGKKAAVEDDDDEAETPTKKRKTPKVVKAGGDKFLFVDEDVKAEED